MERTITVTLNKAIEWYNSENTTLKELALQAFNENELKYDFRSITTFEKACEALEFDYDDIDSVIGDLIDFTCDKTSVAMFKLRVIRKALNLGQDLHLAKNPKDSYIYYPSNPLIATDSKHYEYELNHRKMEVIGKIKSEGNEYCVLGGGSYSSKCEGLGSYISNHKLGYSHDSAGFLGCASKEIAEHFGKYFGMLITEAKYGNIVDFEILDNYYKN